MKARRKTARELLENDYKRIQDGQLMRHFSLRDLGLQPTSRIFFKP